MRHAKCETKACETAAVSERKNGASNDTPSLSQLASRGSTPTANYTPKLICPNRNRSAITVAIAIVRGPTKSARNSLASYFRCM